MAARINLALEKRSVKHISAAAAGLSALSNQRQLEACASNAYLNQAIMKYQI